MFSTLIFALGGRSTPPIGLQQPDPPSHRIAIVPQTGMTDAEWTQYAEERLDYGFDFSLPLESDVIVSQRVYALDKQIKIEGIRRDDKFVAFWLSGGRRFMTTWIICILTTRSGRIFESKVKFKVQP